MKDRFSHVSVDYQQYRPSYPIALWKYLSTLLPKACIAWDCGCGTGQATAPLKKICSEVWATDISKTQLAQAPPLEGVIYQQASAEKSGLLEGHFNLILAAQAAHWFHLPAFYQEAQRVASPNARLLVMGYGLIETVHVVIQAAIHQLYFQILSGYWDIERRHIDSQYSTLYFPFETLPWPDFYIQVEWCLSQLLGYLNTWSAKQPLLAAGKSDEWMEWEKQLTRKWPNSPLEPIGFTFPIFGKMANLNPA